MITGKVRLSYLQALEPKENLSGLMKYSVCCLIPKEDEKTMKQVEKAVDAAIKKGIKDGKFSKAHVPTLKLPVRDGDLEHEAGTRGEEYKGCWFFNCSGDKRPGIIDKTGAPIFDEDVVYSGTYGRVDVGFFPYNRKGSRGVGVGFNNLMILGGGERLDGRQSAEEAFAQYVEDEDTEVEGDLE